LFDEMTTGAPASEQTKVKYSAVDLSRTRAGLASDWRTWLIGALIVLVIAYFWHAHRQAVEAAAAQKNVHPMVPVSAVQAERGDLDLYLTAIGAVTPFNTTTIKSRVDGAIQNIFYTEGQTVKAGDILIQIDPRPYQVQLAQAVGQSAKDQATYEDGKTTFARDQVLYSQGVLSRQQLDDQQSVMNQAKGAVESDRGAIDSAKLNITYSRITAPISGRIGLRLLDLGNIVHATDTTGLAVITQLQPIAVIFALPEDDIPRVVKRIASGQSVTVQAWDRDFTKQLSSGTLLTFDNQIDQTTGTVKLKAQFDNPDYALFPSQFVNARLLINTVNNTVLIPTAAVQKSPQGNFVYLVKPDNSVMQRGITVGAAQGDLSSIKSGVNQGDTVVTDGVDKLQPGAKVSVHLATFALNDHPTAQ
jgi:membrane fusion protein, multidrug efflux system